MSIIKAIICCGQKNEVPPRTLLKLQKLHSHVDSYSPPLALSSSIVFNEQCNIFQSLSLLRQGAYNCDNPLPNTSLGALAVLTKYEF